MSILSKIKKALEDEEVEKKPDLYFNRDKKIMATILMPTVEEKKKEEVELPEKEEIKPNI